MEHHLKAIAAGNINATYTLGSYYGRKKDFNNMIKYYNMGINKG